MHEHISLNQHNPTQKFHQKKKKKAKALKIFKNPKPRSKNAWMQEKEGI